MIRYRHRSLPEIQARARAELNRNPTITTYVWRDGREIRSRTAPWAKLRRDLQKIGQAFLTIRPSFDRFNEQVQAALAAMPAASVRRVGLLPPAGPPRLLSVADSLSPAPPRHPDLDVFDQAVADYEARLDCPHDSSSGGYGPERTWRCDECGEITGQEEDR